jgi:hypothetical protein
MDETGISTVQDPGLILAPKGQKRVGSITSWERGKNVTVVCTLSANSSLNPPMFIFPRQRMSHVLEKDVPSCAIYHCSKSGWINEDLFMVWLKHFAGHTSSSIENPVLFILDNHSSHCTLEAYKYCRENGIVVVPIPPHTSHRLQPLDVTCYGPLKTAFRRESDLFIKAKGLEKITRYDLAGTVNKAYSQVATITKGVSGFKVIEIYPLGPSVFTEEDFISLNTLQSDNGENLSGAHGPDIIGSSYLPEQEDSTISQNSNLFISCQPSCSKDTDLYCPATVSSLPVPVETVSSLPVMSPQTPCRQSRAKQHSEILTGTPIKVSLESKAIKRNARSQKKSRPTAISSKKRQEKETLQEESKETARLSSSEEDTDINDQNICDDNEEDGRNIW